MLTATAAPALIAARYQIDHVLGAGGMGTVYAVTDWLTGQRLAMKRLTGPHHSASRLTTPQTAYAYTALEREFQLLAALRHPHIVSVQDFGLDETRTPFFTMELLNAPQDCVTALAGTDLPTTLHALIAALHALTYLHQSGILHGDIKPHNLLVTTDGGVKLVDFGLAGSAATYRHGGGTFAYLAPELLDQQPPSPASDLYALGLIAYHLLVGTLPYNAESLGRLFYQIRWQPISMPDTLPAALCPVLTRWLAKDPAERYVSARAVIADLCAAAGLPPPVEDEAVQASFLRAARFVGRERELTTLRGAIDDARLGDGSAWLISAASGMGKSRLLAEIRTYALLRGCQVLRADSPEAGATAYSTLGDLIAPLLLGTLLTPDEVAALRFALPDLPGLAAYTTPAAPDLGTEITTARLQSVLAGLLSRQRAPLLLLLEDVQRQPELWPWLRWLAGLTRNREIVLLATARGEEAPDLHAALPDFQPLLLAPLSAAAVEDLITAIIGPAHTMPDFVQTVATYAEGNVFFMIDLLHALAQRTASLTAVGTLTVYAEDLLTPGVVAVARRRLARLPERYHAALFAAAVLGREVDPALLRQIDPTLPDDESWLALAAAYGLLTRADGGWYFDHDKIRVGLLEDQSVGDRATLHRSAAEALEAVYPRQAAYEPRLLHHWRQAGDTAKERYYLDRVAQAWADRGLAREAHDLLRTALPRFNSDPAALATLLLPLARVHKLLGDYAASMETAQRGAALADQVGQPLLHRDYLGLLGSMAREQGDFDRAETYQQAALMIAQQTGDSLAMARSLLNLATVKAAQGHLVEAEAQIREAYALATALEHPLGQAITGLAWANIARYQGDRALAWTHFTQALALARAHQFAVPLANALSGIAVLEADAGRLEAGQAALTEAIALMRQAGDHRMLALLLALRGLLTERHGQPAPDDLREALLLAHGLQLIPTIGIALIGWAYHTLRAGDALTAAQIAGWAAVGERVQAFNRDHLVALIAAIRARLDDTAYKQAAAAGRDQPLSTWITRLLGSA